MSDTVLRLAGVIRESIVDGPGIRFTVFVQGCPHRCPGCHNPQSHDFEGGRDCSIEKLMQEIQRDPLLQGVTFSGGEPFCQAQALADLGPRIKHECNFDLIVYTGYTYEQLCQGLTEHPEWKELLDITDYLVDGPFVLDQRDLELHFRGSRNQRILDMAKTQEAGRPVPADFS